jgi:hypothetical protein
MGHRIIIIAVVDIFHGQVIPNGDIQLSLAGVIYEMRACHKCHLASIVCFSSPPYWTRAILGNSQVAHEEAPEGALRRHTLMGQSCWQKMQSHQHLVTLVCAEEMVICRR